MELSFRIAEFGSKEYKESVKLRSKILREPLGMKFTEQELLEEKSQQHLVCVIKENIAAIALMKNLDKKTVKLRQFAVEPLLQGKGIGKELVKFFEQQATASGFSNIELNAREIAVPFYEKQKYKIDGEQFEEVGIPHFRMTKQIE